MDTATVERPHSVIWLDRMRARIFIQSPGKQQRLVVEPGHKGGATSRVPTRHTGGDNRYFDAIVLAIPPAGDILILGPDGVKTELCEYLKANAAPVAERVRAVQNSTAGSEGQMLARARAFFLSGGAARAASGIAPYSGR